MCAKWAMLRPGKPLSAHVVASVLRRRGHVPILDVLDPHRHNAIERHERARPSVIIMDNTVCRLSGLYVLSRIVRSLANVRILWLDPTQQYVQLLTSERRAATNASDLIEMIDHS